MVRSRYGCAMLLRSVNHLSLFEQNDSKTMAHLMTQLTFLTQQRTTIRKLMRPIKPLHFDSRS